MRCSAYNVIHSLLAGPRSRTLNLASHTRPHQLPYSPAHVPTSFQISNKSVSNLLQLMYILRKAAWITSWPQVLSAADRAPYRMIIVSCVQQTHRCNIVLYKVPGSTTSSILISIHPKGARQPRVLEMRVSDSGHADAAVL